MGGGKKNKPVVYDILVFENRQIFYLINYIPDELYILLRISDTLMECFFKDLFRKNDFERNFKERIEKKMNELLDIKVLILFEKKTKFS